MCRPLEGDHVVGVEADADLFAERVKQGVGDLADVSGIGRVEGRADFEEDLPYAARQQPFECRKRLRHGLDSWNRARF